MSDIFRNILVVVDSDTGTHEAPGRAARIAARNNAELSALCVVKDAPALLKELFAKENPGWMEHETALLERAFGNAMAAAMPGISSVSTALREGDIVIEAIREVLRHSYDLVVKDRPPATESPKLSGTDMRLLRKCPCPVWLVGPPPARGLGRVLAAIDIGPSPEAIALCSKIVKTASALLGTEEGELHVAHMWNDMGLAYWKRKMSLEECERYSAMLKEKHAALLESFVGSLDIEIPRSRVHLIETEPIAGIPALAAQLQVSTIVMGTVARGGLAGLLMGNTAEQVLQRIECSVLAVKPDGFESPVRLG